MSNDSGLPLAGVRFKGSFQEDSAKGTLTNQLAGGNVNATQTQFWYNPDQNQYYLIDWKGKRSPCDQGGKPKFQQRQSPGGAVSGYLSSLTQYEGFSRQQTGVNSTQQLRQSNQSSNEMHASRQKNTLEGLGQSRQSYFPVLNKLESQSQFMSPHVTSTQLQGDNLPDILQGGEDLELKLPAQIKKPPKIAKVRSSFTGTNEGDASGSKTRAKQQAKKVLSPKNKAKHKLKDQSHQNLFQAYSQFLRQSHDMKPSERNHKLSSNQHHRLT